MLTEIAGALIKNKKFKQFMLQVQIRHILMMIFLKDPKLNNKKTIKTIRAR